MLCNIIRLGVKNNNKEGILRYISLPAFWRSKEKAEESLNLLIEHNKMVKNFNKARSEKEKEEILNEIKTKAWFYSGVSACEEKAKLSGNRMDLKEYKQELHDLSLNKEQNDWQSHLFMFRDDNEKFVMPVFWSNEELDLHNVKLMKK